MDVIWNGKCNIQIYSSHTSVLRFYFQFLINVHKILSKITLGGKYIGSSTSEQYLNFCKLPGNYKNLIYESTKVFYIPVVENRQNALFERLASQLLVLDQQAGPKGQPLLFCDQPTEADCETCQEDACSQCDSAGFPNWSVGVIYSPVVILHYALSLWEPQFTLEWILFGPA